MLRGNDNKFARSRLLAATAVLFASVPAPAQSVDTSEWICEFCPFSTGHNAEYEVGATSASDESAYFGDASGYDDEGVYTNLDGRGGFASDQHRLRWTLEDLGLDSRYADLDGNWSGKLDYKMSYRELPRRQYFTSQSIFETGAGNTLVLPQGWVNASTTGGFTELGRNLARRDIGSDRKTLDIGGRYRPADHWRLSASYARQDRSGTDVVGGSYFTQSSLLPGHIDSTTDTVDLGATYFADHGYLALGWHLSEFENGLQSLTWENPFLSQPGAGFAALATAPDNSLQQLSLSGNYRFPAWRTVISFSGALGRLEQNEPFLPYTINPNLAGGVLPRSNLNAQVDTTRYSLAVSSRPIDKARIKLAYRYDDRSNDAAQDLWNRVILDSFPSNETELNLPYSFERTALNLSADYDLFDSIRVSGGYDRKTIDRDFQEVAEQTEDSGWGRVRWQPVANLEIDVRGGAAERDIDRYNEDFALLLGQNPLLRKYNLAYRYRRFGEATIAASFGDTPLSLSLTGLYADDSYSKSLLGLTEADDLQLAADLSWRVGEFTSIYLNAGYENIEAKQAGSESFASADWRAGNVDEFNTVGLGFNMRQIGEKFALQMDYTRSEGTSDINIDSQRGAADALPTIESTIDYFRLRLDYRHSARLRLSALLRYQSIVASDWALAGVAPATIPDVLTLGVKPYDEDLFLFGIGFALGFDAAHGTTSE